MLQVYDRVLPSGSIPTLTVLFGIVVVLFVFLGFFDFLRGRLLSRIALRVDRDMSMAVFRKGLTVKQSDDTSFSNKQAMHDLDTVRTFLSGPATTAMADLVFVPLFLGLLFLIHPWIGALTIAGAAIGALIALINRFATRDAIQQTLACDTVERNFTAHSQRNVETIKAMGMGNAIEAQWQQRHLATLATSQRGSDPSEVLMAASKSFRILLQSMILTLGAFLVLRGEITAGMIIAGSILSGRALAPMDQIIGQWRATGAFSAAHKRLEVAFEDEPAAAHPINLPDPTGQISVHGLAKFASAHKSGERVPILSQVTFDLNPGDAMGVVGNSASGKTTLARLLVGVGSHDAGEIRLDGACLDEWDPERLGRSIGYLSQTLEMLPGTIQENISRFDKGSTDDAVIVAAKQTGIHNMILKLPNGYSTRLCDPDSPPLLSGGQMQRLGLARAIYGMPKLVVLDEPNANLDVEGNAALAETIQYLRDAGSTVIVMAHRPDVMRVVNKLMVLVNGKMGVFGDRETLLSEDYNLRSKTAAPSVADAASVQAPHPDSTIKPLSSSVTHLTQKASPTSGPSVVRMAGPMNRKREA
jgi:PrtD family type I secretion system ABC transporter